MSKLAKGMGGRGIEVGKGAERRVWKSLKGMGLRVQVGHRIIKKRIHVRVEHVKPSRCKEEFLARRAANDEAKHEAKQAESACTLASSLPLLCLCTLVHRCACLCLSLYVCAFFWIDVHPPPPLSFPRSPSPFPPSSLAPSPSPSPPCVCAYMCRDVPAI